MSNLENIQWNDLIDYSPQSKLENRKKILIKLNDQYNRIYYGIVVKHDKNKNVHIRYLDNPAAGKLWWTGNQNGLCGLDSRQYSCKLIGDLCNDMDGLSKDDFCENGYDDIINFEDEGNRFYNSNSDYPYLNGLYGNIYLFEHFINLYDNNEKIFFDLTSDVIPDNILLDIGNPNHVRENIYNITDLFIYNSKYKNEDINNIKGYIKHQLNRQKVIRLVNKYNLDISDLSMLDNVKKDIFDSEKNNEELFLYILSDILDINVIIYKYINKNKFDKIIINEGKKTKIILYNIDKYQFVKLDNEKYNNENNKITENISI
jgi:hypothetical protein